MLGATSPQLLSRTRAQKAQPSTRCNAQAGIKPNESKGLLSKQLARALLQKETALRAIFETGNTMPKAAHVSALRRDSDRLREELIEVLAEGQMLRSPADRTRVVAVMLSQVAATRARQSMSSLQMRLDTPLPSEAFASNGDEEMRRLNAEYHGLRERAHRLLDRQSTLEELMNWNGLNY